MNVKKGGWYNWMNSLGPIWFKFRIHGKKTILLIPEAKSPIKLETIRQHFNVTSSDDVVVTAYVNMGRGKGQPALYLKLVQKGFYLTTMQAEGLRDEGISTSPGGVIQLTLQGVFRNKASSETHMFSVLKDLYWQAKILKQGVEGKVIRDKREGPTY
jgi:hypothetical protein